MSILGSDQTESAIERAKNRVLGKQKKKATGLEENKKSIDFNAPCDEFKFRCHVFHNPFASRMIPADLFDGVPQLIPTQKNSQWIGRHVGQGRRMSLIALPEAYLQSEMT